MKNRINKRALALELAHSKFREKPSTAQDIVADAETFYTFLKGDKTNGA